MSNDNQELAYEALHQAGEILGAAAAAFASGFISSYIKATQSEEAKEGISASERDEIPQRCKQCWCNECGNWEDCIVPIEGYDIESKPCPCDGCNKNTKKRYMPKENPPCTDYRPKEGGA